MSTANTAAAYGFTGPAERIGDAIGRAVSVAITDTFAAFVVSHTHANSYSDPNPCAECDAIRRTYADPHSDDDPTADTAY